MDKIRIRENAYCYMIKVSIIRQTIFYKNGRILKVPYRKYSGHQRDLKAHIAFFKIFPLCTNFLLISMYRHDHFRTKLRLHISENN